MEKFDFVYRNLYENLESSSNVNWLDSVVQSLVDGIVHEFDMKPKSVSIDEVKAEVINLLNAKVDEAFKDFDKVD